MNKENNPWFSGFFALAATVVILFGAQTLYHVMAVSKPLDKAFNNINGVKHIAWQEEDKAVVVYVTFEKVENLQATYKEIADNGRKILGKRPFQIKINDNRNEKLKGLEYDLHFIVQEAIVTGHFEKMFKTIGEKALEKKVDFRIFVDEGNIYLQLKDSDSELYTVFPRYKNVGVI